MILVPIFWFSWIGFCLIGLFLCVQRPSTRLRLQYSNGYMGYRQFGVFNEFSKKVKGEADRYSTFCLCFLVIVCIWALHVGVFVLRFLVLWATEKPKTLLPLVLMPFLSPVEADFGIHYCVFQEFVSFQAKHWTLRVIWVKALLWIWTIWVYFIFRYFEWVVNTREISWMIITCMDNLYGFMY